MHFSVQESKDKMDVPEIEIEKIVLRKVAIPLHEPFRISNGEVATKESVIVELHSGGLIGYGEASPMHRQNSPAG